MKNPIIVPVDQLNQKPYSSVLCFPNPSQSELQNRIQELRSHNITALEFSGTANLFGVAVPVLGKGFVGVVVIAHLKGEKVAVKIRRLDADRVDLLHEAEMLTRANSVNVGPKLVDFSKNFLFMQLIDGDLLPHWLKTNNDSAVVKPVLKEVLEQCFRLDELGLDHGELSQAPKHLLVDKAGKVFIVDFETASVARKVANVNAAGQYLFVSNSSAARLIYPIFGEKREETIRVLKNYKKNMSRENFEEILNMCFG